MALQMFEWISIIMVIKFEETLDIELYEDNLKKSKEVKKVLNRREVAAWCSFKFILSLFFVFGLIKAASAISISLPTDNWSDWIYYFDTSFQDDEFNQNILDV